MQSASADSLLFVLGAATAAVGFIGVVFLLNKVISPRNPTAEKLEPYECGMDQAGLPWAAARMRFATIALLFVLFDAEAILLFAVASEMRGNLVALAEVAVFALFLTLGLALAWKKGALTWQS